MIVLKCFFYAMFLFSAGTFTDKNIVVIGKAANVKGGAVVISNKDHKMYHVGGLSSWDEKIVGKIVRVTGKLYVTETKPPGKDEPEKQQAIGIHRLILKPKWALVIPVSIKNK